MAGSAIDTDVPLPNIETWQEIVDIMAELIGIPAALIMRLKEPDIEVFVSSRTDGNPYHRGDKEKVWGSGLYCETVIKRQEKLLVPDALADQKWRRNPDVKLNMISYLGFPINYPDGSPFGTICVLDNKENRYSESYQKLIRKFRQIVQSDLEILHMNKKLGDKNRRLTDYLAELEALRTLVPICAHCKSIRDSDGNWKSIENYLAENSKTDVSHGICPACVKRHYSEFDPNKG